MHGDLATHPSPENPGTGEPFLITVPFKVYDMEAGEEPVQISIIIYDRIQAFGTGYDGTYDGKYFECFLVRRATAYDN